MPSLVVPNTKAICLRNVTQGHYFTRPIWRRMVQAMQLVRLEQNVRRFGCVGAANLTCTAMERSALRGVCSAAYWLCSNHQTMLGGLSVLRSVCGPSFLKTLTSVASFMNLSTHRLRMMSVLRGV